MLDDLTNTYKLGYWYSILIQSSFQGKNGRAKYIYVSKSLAISSCSKNFKPL